MEGAGVTKAHYQETTGAGLSVRELSGYLGLAEVTIYKMVRERRIPHVRIGRRIVFTRDQIQEWLKEREVPVG